MMKKNLKVILFIGLLLVTTINIMAVSAEGEDSPIYINGNGDFATYASSGSGIISDPYIISGLNETGSDYSLYITNTDAYCVFDNLNLSEAAYSVSMVNVSNVNITNSLLQPGNKGILIENSTYIGILSTIIMVDEGKYGIRIDESDHVLVDNCFFSGGESGIIIKDSYRIWITDNIFLGAGLNFFGSSFVASSMNITGNLVNGKPLGYLEGEHDRVIDISGYGQAILTNCVNVTLHNGSISGTNMAVQFIFSMNSNLALSNITDNYIGLYLYESSYCRVYGNNISGNSIGLYGQFALGTIIYENNVIENTVYGFWLKAGCSSSTIYINNFIDNYINAKDDGGIMDSQLTWAAARFINRESGWPLSNVSVTVERAGRTFTAYTNPNGILKLPVPALGTYDFTIERFRYETKTPSVAITTPGIHLYNVSMDKADLGPGTGYIQMRFMDGATPVVGAVAEVYSYLHGHYYYHSTEISAVSPTGWVNITGLYYDNYFLRISHAGYEPRIINQVVIEDGLVGTFNNIQLTPIVEDPPALDTFAYVYVENFTSGLPVENANVTIRDESVVGTGLTDASGFVNITGLYDNIDYVVEVYKAGFEKDFSIFYAGTTATHEVYLIPPMGPILEDVTVLTAHEASFLPIEGTNVTLINGSGYAFTSLSNSSGYANFYNLVVGIYDVEITSLGYRNEYTVVDLSEEVDYEFYLEPVSNYNFTCYVEDELTGLPMVGTSVIMTDGADQDYIVLTNSTGYAHHTDLVYGVYQLYVSASGYTSQIHPINLVDDVYYEVYMSETLSGEPLSGVVNDYDNSLVGNYWDDAGGIIVLAEESVPYEVPGDNPDNPTDDYPLAEPYTPSDDDVIPEPEPEPEPEPTTTTMPTIPTTTTLPKEDVDISQMLIMMVGGMSIIGIVVVLVLIKRRE